MISTGGRLNVFRALVSCAGTSPDAPFSVSTTPGAQTVDPGGSVSVQVRVVRSLGFTGEVTLTASGAPAGLVVRMRRTARLWRDKGQWRLQLG